MHFRHCKFTFRNSWLEIPDRSNGSRARARGARDTRTDTQRNLNRLGRDARARAHIAARHHQINVVRAGRISDRVLSNFDSFFKFDVQMKQEDARITSQERII